MIQVQKVQGEHSDRVLDMRFEGLGVGASPVALNCVLEQDTFYPYLVLVPPTKTPDMTENMLTGS